MSFFVALLGQDSLDPKVFLNPPLEYGPFTRWWWPGNDVDKEELKREVRMFAENGFGGVEIQPFTTGISPNSTRMDYIYSWDTPTYYSNLIETIQEAKKVGLIIDLNGGSGWPMSSPMLLPSESILSLAVLDTVVYSDGNIEFDIPTYKKDSAAMWRAGQKTHYDVSPEFYQLENVIAAKVIKVSDKILLDSTQLFDVPIDFKTKKINWKSPSKGYWCIIFTYIGPDGEKPLYVATKKTSWVVDPLSTMSLDKTLTYLLGSRTNLSQFYGNPIRAIFMDSKEFIVDRHVSSDFVDCFKKKRGYDISRYLFINGIKGYDNAYSFGRDTIPRYVISENDWRIKYDYNKTISELFAERQYKYVSDWLENRKMYHRAQTYGHRGDVISNSGMSSIPEAEQLYGRSSDALVKLVTSGAHLNNKPVITQESFVFAAKAYMTTPQKIRVYANKSFAQGINQIIYHGTAYQYKNDEYGDEGWYPWSSPYKRFNYSSNINESNAFWKHIKDVNQYIARSQYALRAGKPKTEVLIYFPFIDFEASQIVLNPHDKVVSGSYDRDEPQFYEPSKKMVQSPTDIQKYFIELWDVVNKLEALGLTWGFVNDDFLREAKASGDGKILINGNNYNTLVVPEIPYMSLATAQKLKELINCHSDILIVKQLPDIQPSFFNFAQKDTELRCVFKEIKKNQQVKFINHLEDLDTWFQNINQAIRFNGQYNFIKQQERQMADGSILKFLWNQSDKKQDVELIVDKKYKHSYWLSAEKKIISKNQENSVSYSLEPFEAIMLYVSEKKMKGKYKNAFNRQSQISTLESNIINVGKWDMKTGVIERKNTDLFDLKTDKATQFISDEITYTSTVNLPKVKRMKVTLDLGKVYYTAHVSVNGEDVGSIIWAPYKIDISDFVVTGNNTIKIIVTPTDRNKFIGKGIQQNKYYSSVFSNKKNTLMPAGMVGPVRVLIE